MGSLRRRVRFLPPRQMPVLNAVGLVRGGAKAELSVGLILGVIPIEPDHFAFPLEGQDMCCDAVEEPTVMADDNGATRKILQSLFEGAQGVYVQIIGRLVKQQDIA